MGQAPGLLIFRIHALRRMFSRGVDVAGVRAVLETGSIVEGYPNDDPHPSRLILGFVDERPLHVVVASTQIGMRRS